MQQIIHFRSDWCKYFYIMVLKDGNTLLILFFILFKDHFKTIFLLSINLTYGETFSYGVIFGLLCKIINKLNF